MQRRQFDTLEAARRAYDILTATPPAPPLATMPDTFTQQVQALGATIARLDAQVAAQSTARSAITDTVSGANEAARELRTHHLAAIKSVAQLLVRGPSGDALSPGFADSLQVPNVKSHTALLAAAATTAQVVTPHKDLFVARGLPADFIDQLTAQATTLRQAIQASSTAKATRASATKDLKQLVQELRGTVRVLELGVTKACKADRVNGPATKAAWDTARTIRRSTTPVDISGLFPRPSTTTTSTTTGSVAAPAATPAAQ